MNKTRMIMNFVYISGLFSGEKRKSVATVSSLMTVNNIREKFPFCRFYDILMNNFWIMQ